jgi:TraY domain
VTDKPTTAMEKKRLGRPTKAPEGNERVMLGLRVTADIKRRLDAAAAASGRSQSQEAELRIERSFEGEDAFTRALGGPELRAHIMGMIGAFTAGGQAAAPRRSPAAWLRDGALLAGMPKLTAAEADHLRQRFHSKLGSALMSAAP